MKKILTLLLSGCLLLALAACGAQEPVQEKPITGVTEDALRDISEQELVEATGIDLPAPEGAEDVVYNVLCASQDCPIAEMVFTLNGTSAYLRAQATDFIPEEPDQSASVSGIRAAADITDFDISGLYFEPERLSLCDVAESRPGICWVGDGYGVLAWVDVAPGILYDLCMTENADETTLQTLGDTVFVPLQGEADGDDEAAAE